ncbi:hypothetical protein, partial [Paracidovorax oryzae]|uniref:hypothetical protein n=1 Tax=Paracidovorax oryzae TaxID=862720 RepID=UPI000495D654
MHDAAQLPERLAAHQRQFRQSLGIALKVLPDLAFLARMAAGLHQRLLQRLQALLDEGRRMPAATVQHGGRQLRAQPGPAVECSAQRVQHPAGLFRGRRHGHRGAPAIGEQRQQQRGQIGGEFPVGEPQAQRQALGRQRAVFLEEGGGHFRKHQDPPHRRDVRPAQPARIAR